MILNRLTLSELIKELKALGQKTIFTNGCFDIIHCGHTKYLSEAKKLGDILIVGLNSDDSVKRLKGEDRPINNQKDRALVLDCLKPVDFVTVFDEDTPYNLINLLKPDVLVKGGDYKIDDIVGADIVKKCGGEVVTIDFVEGKSTTNIIRKMKRH